MFKLSFKIVSISTSTRRCLAIIFILLTLFIFVDSSYNRNDVDFIGKNAWDEELLDYCDISSSNSTIFWKREPSGIFVVVCGPAMAVISGMFG